jgi:hypothetical protein
MRRATTLLTTTALRIARIERALLHGQSHTLGELRAMAGGSPSIATIKSDINAMRSELGMQIVYNAWDGCYSLRGGPTIAGVLAEHLKAGQ